MTRLLEELPLNHTALLEATLRAPSAHNVQPWRIILGDDGLYEVHYDQQPNLPEDPVDKDAHLTMGAFVETMTLAAPHFGLEVGFTPDLSKVERDLFVGTAELADITTDTAVDPLSRWVLKRHTDRGAYSDKPLPEGLVSELEAQGLVLAEPNDLKGVVTEATRLAWQDKRYVDDLRSWFRPDNSAEDGITPDQFKLAKSDILALRFAFWREKIKSNVLAGIFAELDSKMFTSAQMIGVLSVENMSPEELHSAGRSLARAWTTINSYGFDYQPFSVAVDNPHTAAKVAEITRTTNPVSIFRIGQSQKPKQNQSNRRPLSSMLWSRRPF